MRCSYLLAIQMDGLGLVHYESNKMWETFQNKIASFNDLSIKQLLLCPFIFQMNDII